MTESYDVVLVGSGMSSLWLAVELLRGAPKAKIAVVESYKSLGGRTSTFHTEVPGIGPVQWEGGAARISSDHRLVLDLVRRYKLHTVRIPHEATWQDTYTSPPEPDTFEAAIPAFLRPLQQLSPEVLGSHTLRELVVKLHGAKAAEEYLIRFPYRAEVDVLRADQALAMFLHEFSRKAEYSVLAEGYSALVDAMEADLRRRGGTILTHHTFVGVTQQGPKALAQVRCLVGAPSEGTSRPTVELEARKVVLAIPPAALGRVPQFAKWPMLERLKMTPLLRFYGVFPLGEDGNPWFHGLGKRITSTPIRFMIPASEKQGVIQLSYTDSQDTEHWTQILEKEGADATGAAMIQELETLLAIKIPKPLLVKAHCWKEGAAYWLPGPYTIEKASREVALHPFPELPAVHVCGDSYSLRQAWVEGALEHASVILPVLQRSSKK
jgi:monoamine oxidase